MIVSIIAFGVFIANFAASYGAESGPVGDVKFHSVTDCDDLKESRVKLDLELIPDDDDGDSVYVRLETPTVLGPSCHFDFVSDKWKDGDWQTNVFNTHDQLFIFGNKYVKTIWANVRETVEPKIASDSEISPGTYEGVIRANSEDIDVPQILYGRFQVTIRIECADDLVVCKVIEADSIAK